MVAVAIEALLIPVSIPLLDRWRGRHIRTIVLTGKTHLVSRGAFPGGVRSFDISIPDERLRFEMYQNNLILREVPYRAEQGRRNQ
jgi:hypothetical protein